MSIDEEMNYGDYKFKQKTIGEAGNNNTFFDEKLILMPLYKKIKVNDEEDTCEIFPYNDFRLELYCPLCKKRRIYSFKNPSFIRIGREGFNSYSCEKTKDFLDRIDFFSISAQSDCKHNILITFMKVDNSTIMKIGQFPSIYDLNEEINNKSFLKILGDEYISYYKQACSLYSFNACIGALVYLRRIFEKIMLDTFNENKEALGIEIEAFNKMRMEDKLAIIKNYLPEVLFEEGFNVIYSKISDGVHNLTEDDCREIFVILKTAIEEVLIDKIEIAEKKKRRETISKQISGINK